MSSARTRSKSRGGEAGRSRRPTRTAGGAPQASRQAILVLGMHRSGTSALTRVLGLSGATLPAHPMGASELNPRGFFESDAIYRLHEELFEAFGTAWDDLSPMPDGWVDTGLGRQFVEKMVEVVRGEFDAAPLFVVKDPRACRLVPFWNTVLQRIETEPLYVLPVRNPLEVSSSLWRAQGVHEQHGRLLWLQHVLMAERDTRGERRVFLTYDQLLEDWRAVLKRLASGLDLTFPRASRRVAAEIDGFLTESLRHHELPSGKVEVREDVNEWVRGVWSWVEGAAGGSRMPSMRTMDKIGEAFFAAEAAFGPVVAEQEQSRREQAAEAGRLREEITRLGDAREHPVVEVPASPDALDMRIGALTESIHTLLSMWAVDLRTRGVEPGHLLEPLLRRIEAAGPAVANGADSEPVIELEWVQQAVESGVRESEETAARHRELEAELAGARREIDRLAGVEASLASERSRIVELDDRARTREQDLVRLEAIVAEHANTADRLAAAEARCDEWSQASDARERELAELRVEAAELDALRDRIEVLVGERDGLRRAVDEHAGELSRVRSARHEAELETARYKSEVAGLEQTRGQLVAAQSSIQGLEGRSAALEALVAERDGKLADREAVLAGQAGALADLESDLAKRDEELRGLRSQLQEVERGLDEARAVAVERDGLRDRLEAAGEERERLRSNVDGLEEDLRALRTRHQHLELARAEEASRLQRELDRVSAFEERAAELQSSLETAKTDRAELEAAFTRIAELEALVAERTSEAAFAAELQEVVRAGEAELRSLRADALQLPRLRARLVESEAALERVREEARTELADRTEEICAALEDREVEIARLRGVAAEAAHLGSEMKIRESELKSAAAKYEDLRSHADRVDGELEEARRERDCARDELAEVVEGELDEARRERDRAREELAEVKEVLRITRDGEDRIPGPLHYQTGADPLPVASAARVLGLPRRAGKLLWWAASFQLRARLKDRRAAARIRASGLFDDQFYLANAPESPEAFGDPVMHYVRCGAAEGRDPSAAFSTRFYLDTNADVVALGCNPLDHFAQYGWQEGRRPHPFFDVDYYLRTYPDVAESGENPLRHWLHQGWREGRQPGRPEKGARPLGPRGARSRPVPAASGVDSSAFPHAPGQNVPRKAGLRDSSGLGRSAAGFGRSGLVGEKVPAPKRLEAGRAPSGLFSVHALGVDVERTTERDDPVVFVVTHELPHPPRAGNQYRISRYIHWLRSRGNQVITVYCPLTERSATRAEVEAAAHVLEDLIVCERSGAVMSAVAPHWQRVLGELDGAEIVPFLEGLDSLEGEDADAQRERVALEQSYCPDALARLVLHLDAALDGPAVVITNYIWVTRYLDSLRPATLSIIDTHDMFSTKKDKVKAFGVTNELELTPEQERALLLRGGVTMAIQPEEARAFEALVPERKVLTVGVDFDPVPAVLVRDEDAAPVLGLVGSGNAMNVKGANDFLRFAWPMIRRECPDVTVRVAGAVCASLPRDVEGVELLGVVDSLPAFYAGCDVVVNPTAAGTGLKIKTVEALVHGRRIVAWPLGVDGVPEPLLRYCHVVRDWYDFAQQVRDLLDRAKEGGVMLSQQDVALVQEGLAAATVYAELGDAIDRRLRGVATEETQEDG